MSHRVISGDGSDECFACGVHVDNTDGADTSATFDLVPCRSGGWDHPPYLMPDPDERDPFPCVETCAAHPYAGCQREAMATAHGIVTFDSALPQDWVDDVHKLTGTWPVGIVWAYRYADGRDLTWGEPAALTREGRAIIATFEARVAAHRECGWMR